MKFYENFKIFKKFTKFMKLHESYTSQNVMSPKQKTYSLGSYPKKQTSEISSQHIASGMKTNNMLRQIAKAMHYKSKELK